MKNCVFPSMGQHWHVSYVFVWVTWAGISLNSDKQNSSSTTSAKTACTYPRVVMAHQTLISWGFYRARDSQAPCPVLIYSWLLIPKGCEVLTEGPALMLNFTSIFLEKIRLEKAQGSSRECKMSGVLSNTDKIMKLPGKSCLYGSGWLHWLVFPEELKCSRTWPFPSQGVCQFFSHPWPCAASCSPALLPLWPLQSKYAC